MRIVTGGNPTKHIPLIILAVIVVHGYQIGHRGIAPGIRGIDAKIIAHIFDTKGIHPAGTLKSKIIIVDIQTESIRKLCKAIDVADKLIGPGGSIIDIINPVTDTGSHIHFVFKRIESGIDGIVQMIGLHKWIARGLITRADIFCSITKIQIL